MPERQAGTALDAVAHKWRLLAERRRAHFADMFHSGRWKHYYTEDQFLQRMRDSIRMAERWAVIAPPPADAAGQAVVEAIAPEEQRVAA
jgi:uncharacterized repeat protein (TIGR03809 family)